MKKCRAGMRHPCDDGALRVSGKTKVFIEDSGGGRRLRAAAEWPIR